MAILKKSTPKKSETRIVPDDQDGTLGYIEKDVEENAFADLEITGEEGELALDVFQTAEEIVVVAPIAGVKISDLSITITDEVLTVKGKRNLNFKIESGDYLAKECFWGNFSRCVILPEDVDLGAIRASFKNGILTVRIPKVERVRTRMVKIKEE